MTHGVIFWASATVLRLDFLRDTGHVAVDLRVSSSGSSCPARHLPWFCVSVGDSICRCCDYLQLSPAQVHMVPPLTGLIFIW